MVALTAVAFELELEPHNSLRTVSLAFGVLVKFGFSRMGVYTGTSLVTVKNTLKSMSLLGVVGQKNTGSGLILSSSQLRIKTCDLLLSKTHFFRFSSLFLCF